MTRPTVNELISRIPSGLGSYAPVLKEIEAALESPERSLGTVSEAIEKDADLTARLLRLGNSSFYGFSTRLATVNEAISLIGIQQVRDLVLASAVIDQFSGVAAEFVSMESFWQHSLACGIGARRIANERRLPQADKFFVAGLLHDIGRLVLIAHAPEVAQRVFHLYHQERLLLTEAERRVLGFDHQQIGGALLQLWKFPISLVLAVASHHEPDSCEAACEEASVVHLSDHLVNAMQMGSSGECHVPPLSMKAWKTLGFQTTNLPSIVNAIDEQFEAVQDIFVTQGKGGAGEKNSPARNRPAASPKEGAPAPAVSLAGRR
jgi:putative nucleotidyltransferase with HDIG domain